MFKFIYDVLFWVNCNYSELPLEFKKRFPEKCFMKASFKLSDFESIEQVLSDLHTNFNDYEKEYD